MVPHWLVILQSGMVSSRKYIRHTFASGRLEVCIHSTERKLNIFVSFFYAGTIHLYSLFLPVVVLLWYFTYMYLESVYMNKTINLAVPVIKNEYIYRKLSATGQPCKGRINRHKFRSCRPGVLPQLQQVFCTGTP